MFDRKRILARLSPAPFVGLCILEFGIAPQLMIASDYHLQALKFQQHPPNLYSESIEEQNCTQWRSTQSDPFDLIRMEGFGDFKLNFTSSAIINKLGKPQRKGELALWGADGLYHQNWNYPQQGLMFNMVSSSGKGDQTVFSITLTSPSHLKTQRGIQIGDSRQRVIELYGDEEEQADNQNPESFVAGSIYGGLIFTFEADRVTTMFLGSAAE